MKRLLLPLLAALSFSTAVIAHPHAGDVINVDNHLRPIGLEEERGFDQHPEGMGEDSEPTADVETGWNSNTGV